MNWFKRFFSGNRRFEYEHVSKDIPFSTLIRWFIYDTDLVDPNEASVLMGMNPVSDEGNAKEQEDSDLRLTNVDELMPFIITVAEISSKTLTNIQLFEMSKAGDAALDDAEIESIKNLYMLVGLSSIVSAFSSALELGLIEKSVFISNVERLEVEEDEQ
jgi:hypothetical protein